MFEELQTGMDVCGAKALPKDYMESLVIKQLQSKVLTDDNLEALVVLVNEELQSASYGLEDRMDAINAELKDVTARLSKLYDAVETGKIDLEDLTPRIRELKSRQDELRKNRIQMEADMVVHGVEQVDLDTVKSYAQDLPSLIMEAGITERKAFLRSFIRRIEINGDRATINYLLPFPQGKKGRT
jgi:chromosome segregation ATPase